MSLVPRTGICASCGHDHDQVLFRPASPAPASAQEGQGGLTEEQRKSLELAAATFEALNIAGVDNLRAILSRQPATTMGSVVEGDESKHIRDQITADANCILRLLDTVDKLMGSVTGATESIQEHAQHIVKYAAKITAPQPPADSARLKTTMGSDPHPPHRVCDCKECTAYFAEADSARFGESVGDDAKCKRCSGEAMIYVEDTMQPCPDCQDLSDYHNDVAATDGNGEPPLPHFAMNFATVYSTSDERSQYYTAEQMRAYARTYHAHMMSKLGGESVDTDAFCKLLDDFVGAHFVLDAVENEKAVRAARKAFIAHIDAKLAQARAAGGGVEGIDLDKLEELANRATPGPWYVDRIENDGDYGSGPDTRSGFWSRAICDENKGLTLFDTLNSDACAVEGDDDGAYDSVGQRNAEFVAAVDPTTVRKLIAASRRASGAGDGVAVPSDEAIERAALKHVATHWERVKGTPLYHSNYRQTDQFARLKAFALELAAAPSATAEDAGGEG